MTTLVPALTSVFFYMQSSVIRTRITSLFGSQTSPVVLCMQYSVICTRMTCLYGSQTSPVVLCTQYSVICTGFTSLYWSHHSSEVSASKTTSFGPELQVSMVPSTHLWFFDAKRRLFDHNNKSLRVPDITCHCVHAKLRD